MEIKKKFFSMSGLSIWRNDWPYNIYKIIAALCVANNVLFLYWDLFNNLVVLNIVSILENLTISIAFSTIVFRYILKVIM